MAWFCSGKEPMTRTWQNSQFHLSLCVRFSARFSDCVARGVPSLQSPESSRGWDYPAWVLLRSFVAIFYVQLVKRCGFQQLHALTRERIALVLTFRGHFQSLGTPWVRRPLNLDEFLLPCCREWWAGDRWMKEARGYRIIEIAERE